MRTAEDIVARIREIEKTGNDWLGTIRLDLISYLPFAEAKEWLKPEVTEAEWKTLPRDRESVVAQIVDYFPFAYEKAENQRGISAKRSINHMQAWLWMIGEDSLADEIKDYHDYGIPQLNRIKRELSIDV